MRLFDSSQRRLTLAYASLFTVGAIILCTSLYFAASSTIDASIERRLLEESARLAELVQETGPAAVVAAVGRARQVGGSSRAILLVDRSGQRLAGNLAAWPAGYVGEAGRVRELDVDVGANASPSLRPMRLALQALPDGNRLLYGEDMSERRRYASVFRATAVTVGLLLGILGALFVLAFAQRFGRRMSEAAAACERVIDGDLGQRLPVLGSDDPIDRVALSVNRMLDRIQELTRSRRTVFDSAAHDLRGPLYRLRNRIESQMRRSQRGLPVTGLDEALRDIDGLQRTLVVLLEIARAESGEPLHDVRRFDLSALARDVVDLFAPVARAESLTLLSQVRVPVGIDGNRQLVGQLLSNLVENAIKYVPAGGTITVAATRGAQGMRLVVSDDGPGIPAGERERASQPFVRLVGSECVQGSGLGLSLVAAIARLHGASLSLEDNRPGLRVVVEFPFPAVAADPPAAQGTRLVGGSEAAGASAR